LSKEVAWSDLPSGNYEENISEKIKQEAKCVEFPKVFFLITLDGDMRIAKFVFKY
jgi:hypothetical protein